MTITLLDRQSAPLTPALTASLSAGGHRVHTLSAPPLTLAAGLSLGDALLLATPAFEAIYLGLHAQLKGAAVFPDPRALLRARHRLACHLLAAAVDIPTPLHLFGHGAALAEHLTPEDLPLLRRDLIHAWGEEAPGSALVDTAHLRGLGEVYLERPVPGRRLRVLFVGEALWVAPSDDPTDQDAPLVQDALTLAERWRGVSALPWGGVEVAEDGLHGRLTLSRPLFIEALADWPEAPRLIARHVEAAINGASPPAPIHPPRP